MQRLLSCFFKPSPVLSKSIQATLLCGHRSNKSAIGFRVIVYLYIQGRKNHDASIIIGDLWPSTTSCHLLFGSRQRIRDKDTIGYRPAKLVTSLRKTIRASCQTHNTILGHSLYDLGQGTGHEVFYALECSYSMCLQWYCIISIVSWFFLCLMWLLNINYKSKQFYLHARVVNNRIIAELWDRCT